MNAITQVREGMRVVGADGDDLGKVSEVKMGDPEAMTSQGQQPDEQRGGMVGFAGGDNDPGDDLPPQHAERLRRTGYVKIKTGLLGSDEYVAADDIDRVEGDTVYVGQRTG
jgi:hypothetical protein